MNNRPTKLIIEKHTTTKKHLLLQEAFWNTAGEQVDRIQPKPAPHCRLAIRSRRGSHQKQ